MLPEGFILRMQSLLGEEYAAFSARLTGRCAPACG